MFRLKELRLNSGITQKQLANHLRIAQNTLSYWENEKYEPDSENLAAIADYFDVSVDYLLGKTETKKAPVESDKGNKSAAVLEFQNLVRSISLDQVREVKAFLSLSDEQRRAILALAKIDLDDKEES